MRTARGTQATAPSGTAVWPELAKEGVKPVHPPRSDAEHPVELVDQEIDCEIPVFVEGGGSEIGTRDLDVPARGKSSPDASMLPDNVDPHEQDPRLMAEQFLRFLAERCLHGIGKAKVDTAEDDLG